MLRGASRTTGGHTSGESAPGGHRSLPRNDVRNAGVPLEGARGEKRSPPWARRAHLGRQPQVAQEALDQRGLVDQRDQSQRLRRQPFPGTPSSLEKQADCHWEPGRKRWTQRGGSSRRRSELLRRPSALDPRIPSGQARQSTETPFSGRAAIGGRRARAARARTAARPAPCEIPRIPPDPRVRRCRRCNSHATEDRGYCHLRHGRRRRRNSDGRAHSASEVPPGELAPLRPCSGPSRAESRDGRSRT